MRPLFMQIDASPDVRSLLPDLARRTRVCLALFGIAVAGVTVPTVAAQERDLHADQSAGDPGPQTQRDVDPLDEAWFERFVMRVRQRGESEHPLEVYDFRPVFGGLRSGAGTTAGIVFEPFTEEDPIHLSTSFRASLRGYWGTEALFGLESNPFVGFGYARYRHMPQEDFYGLGPNTPRSQHATYRLDELIVGGLAGYHPGGNLLLGGDLSFLENRVGGGSDRSAPEVLHAFSAPQAPGMQKGVSYLVAGTWAEFDTRDLPPLREYGSRFAPSQRRLDGLSLDARRGVQASAEIRRYLDFDGGDYGFTRLTLESQQYIPIRGGDQVIALREFGAFSRPDRNEVIPAYMMQPLGGVSSLRGFDNFRFRDLNLVLVNAEVRWHVWHPLQLAVFTDAGHVFRNVNDLSFGDLEASYGAGARLLFGGRVFIRVEAARSREGTTTYVKVGSFL